MKEKWKALTAAFITAAVVTLIGVVFFFRPIAEADTGPAVAAPAPIALLIYVGLCVALFHWLAGAMSSAWKAAFAVAACQYALVIDLTMRGERGLVTMIASGVRRSCDRAEIIRWTSSFRSCSFWKRPFKRSASTRSLTSRKAICIPGSPSKVMRTLYTSTCRTAPLRWMIR